jgi:hypothetical protein
MNFLANLNASVLNCNDLQGIVNWHRATTIELNSLEISDSQLEAHYYEFNGGLVPMLGPSHTTRRSSMEYLISWLSKWRTI